MAALTERRLRARGPARTRCAHVRTASEKAIADYIASREPGEPDWYMRPESQMSPYQQRQLAQLTTGSEYAACRGKRGRPEDRLCECGQRKHETTEHVLLECPVYSMQRERVNTAMQKHIEAVRSEYGYALEPAEALRWAIDDHSPGWVLACDRTESSLEALRGAVLDMHREVRQERYTRQKAAPAQWRTRAL